MDSGTKIQSGRLDSIDALRGVAALMVGMFHVWGLYGVYPFPSLGAVVTSSSAGFFDYLISPLRWGFLGVSLFLVLSGFCIHLPFARRKLRTGKYGFEARTFYLRRLWRLYPAYAASVVGTFLFITATAPMASKISITHTAPSHTWGDLLSHLTLMHGYFDRYFYSIVHVYWSLALEFQLYLAYPLFLLCFAKLGTTRSLAILTVVAVGWRIIAQTAFHQELISIGSTGPYWMMGLVFARMPEWLAGAWLAEWFAREGHLKVHRLPLVALSLAVLFTAILTTLEARLWALSDIIFELGFALLIAACLVPTRRASVPSSSRFYRLFVWMGTISYSIYLFHDQLSWLPKPFIPLHRGDPGNFLVRLLVLAISIPIIAVIFRVVEAPFLRPPKEDNALFGIYKQIERFLRIKPNTPQVAQS